MAPDLDDPNDDFIASASFGKRLLLFLACLGFVAIGLWLAGLLGSEPGDHRHQPGAVLGLASLLDISPRVVVHAIGWLSIVFFGPLAVLIARLTFVRGVDMRAGPSGIWWRRCPDKRLPWEGIARIAVTQASGTRFLSVWLANPSYDPRAPGKRRNLNKAMGFGDIAYSLTGTDRRLDDLLVVVARYRPDLLELA